MVGVRGEEKEMEIRIELKSDGGDEQHPDNNEVNNCSPKCAETPLAQYFNDLNKHFDHV